ncbi:family 4 glycosyl hydrolase alpha-galactosidase/6-phospho-beta-glucosidase [Clostridium pasteurianum]|uniref:Family 4 glycosyl hydrolase, alpha-galactosidase/6-phospho-beta-glucosidase n=1 Tax=Clostridium pasteurianum BC1 TaxID=86416 RepID=R4K9X5_CLOPA|nr:family 4 glycosyl hydrolase alpha-galactosidase/6-phospho-beta-glucosidase [Clostridium pasteurianum]AGK98481.1 family 4 glycosyl hydrolase, alpha-galactosidase/6-phospho-beta-glucosidase [Clostridium pasteurianum BC1]
MEIALIGGGGVRTVFFTKSIIKRSEKIGIDSLVLMDNDEKRLNIITKLCSEAAKEMNSKINIRKTIIIEDAVKNADFIVTTIRVGKEKARANDERIALKYGVLGQETTGAGGFSMAIRTIPVALNYYKLISEINPKAWILNFTNPSGLVTQAARDKGLHKVIGICDAPSELKSQIAAAEKVEYSKLDFEQYGINHLSWTRKVVDSSNNKDVIKNLLQDDRKLEKINALAVFEKDLINMLGVLPNEYLYYYYYREKSIKNILSSNYTRGEYIEKINNEMFYLLEKIDINNKPKEALQIYYKYCNMRENSYMSVETNEDKLNNREKKLELDFEGYAGVALDFIEGINNEKSKEIILSVPNEGAIANMKDDDVVEVTCNIGKSTVKPISIGEVSEETLLLMKQVKLYEKLTIDAVFNKSRKRAYEALMAHPLVGSYSISRSIVDEYLNVNKEYVGVWK